MLNGDALVYGYVLDGKGSGKALEWSDVSTWEPDQGLLYW